MTEEHEVVTEASFKVVKLKGGKMSVCHEDVYEDRAFLFADSYNRQSGGSLSDACVVFNQGRLVRGPAAVMEG